MDAPETRLRENGSPGGDFVTSIKVRLTRDYDRPNDELLEFLALSLKLAVVKWCIDHNAIPRERSRFFITIPVQHNRVINIFKKTNHGKEYFLRYMEFKGDDIELALKELTSGDTEDINPDALEISTRFYSRPVRPEDEWMGNGRKRKHEEIVYSEEGFCGPQALVLGLAQQNPSQMQDYRKAAGKKRRIDAARRLYREMGYREQVMDNKTQRGPMAIEDFQSFVDVYKQHRVVIWPKIAGVINSARHIDFVGEYHLRQFDEDQPQPEGHLDPYTIHILYIEEDQHFEYILKNEMRAMFTESMAVNAESRYIRWCDYCTTAFPYKTREQMRIWHEHNCLERSRCKSCGEFFQDLTRHLKDATPCPQGCGVLVSTAIHHGTKTIRNQETGEERKEATTSRTCLKKHLQLCKQNVDCLQCGKKHYPNSPCGAIVDMACYKQLTRDMILEHRCYISHEQSKCVEHGDYLEDISPCPGACKSRGKLAERLIHEARKPEHLYDGLCWVWDTECMMQSYDAKGPFSYNEVTRERGDYMEHIPIICGVMNISTLQMIIWTVWDGHNPLIELLKFIIAQPKGTIMLSHYGSRYDMQLLYNAAVSIYGSQIVDITKGKFVMEGCTVKQVKIKKTILRDSFLHLKEKLDGLPKMLGITDEHFQKKYGAVPKKLIFPYIFCTPETLDYSGPIPDLHFYQPDRKHDKERLELEAWHAEEKRAGKTWVLKDEYLKYFPMDLKILAEAVIAYTNMSIESGFGEPFKFATIPGFSFNILREYMPSYSIPVLRCYPGLENEYEYTPYNEWKLCNDAYRGGLTGNFWLYGEANLAQGEKLCGLDYNSHYPGCMYSTPMPSGDYKFTDFCPETQPSFEDLEPYEGVIVCEIEPTRAIAHPPLHRVIDGRLNFPLLACLTREEAIHAHHNCYNKMPGTSCSRGCVICKKYWARKPQPYTLLEVKHAVKKYGYKIRYVYCMLFTATVRTDIFKDFLSVTYADKVKFADPPELDWSNPDVCKWYISELKKHAGIEIPPEFHDHPQDWHTPNAAMKTMKKLPPNSVYGRMGMSPFKGKVDIVGADYKAELEYEHKHRDTIQGQPQRHGAFSLYKTVSKKPNSTIGKTNVLMAAYITAAARMKIVDDMNLAVSQGCRVIYGDTDSMFFIKPAHAAGPPVGLFLGQLEDDLGTKKGVPWKIVALLPKSYAILNTEGKVIKMRFKGVSGVSGKGGDARNSALVTWNWMEDAAEAMTWGAMAEPVIVHHRQARWKRNELEPKIEWQDSYKIAQAHMGMLKGKLAKSGRIYPLGAENFDWGEEIEWVDGN